MHNNKWQNKSGRGEKFVEVVRLLSADQSNYDVWHLLTSVRFIKLFFLYFHLIHSEKYCKHLFLVL